MSRSLTHPRVAAIALLIAAVSARGHGDVHERIDKLTKKLAHQPSDEILVRRARLYIEEGHGAEARDDLSRALEIAPDRYESYYYLAQANLLLKQPQQALQAVQQFLAKAENGAAKSRGFTLCGDILIAADQPLKAADAYRAALANAAEPTPEHYLSIADALHAAGSSGSVEVLEQGMAVLGSLATLQERALAIEIHTGRHEAALQRLERMLAGKQRVAFLLYKKAVVLRELGRPQQSAQTLQSALAEIEALPPQRRQTRATQQLKDDIQKQLTEVLSRA